MRHEASTERRHSWNAGLRERFRRLESRWNRANPVIPVVAAPSDPGTTAEGTDEWMRFGISVEERRTIENQRPNVLIIGSGPSVERLVRLLEQTSFPPRVRCDACPLIIPPVEVGTLVISHAERLSAVDQQLLFAWLSISRPRLQVITTAAVPLFPAVVRSTFSEALFYRLNPVCLMLQDTPAPQRGGKLS